MKPNRNIRPLIDEKFLIFILSIFFVLLSASFSIASPGDKKWKVKTTDSISSCPAIDSNGIIYVSSTGNNLYAINPDKTIKWVFSEATGDFYSSPAIDSSGTIYVGSIDDNLYAINTDGTRKWAFKTGKEVYSSPAISLDGTIYVGSMDKKVYAINPDGTKKWEFSEATEGIFTSPAIDYDGTLYVGSYDKNLYAINPDGTKKWAFKTGDRILSSAAIGSDGTIYVGSDDNKLYALKSDGTIKWIFSEATNNIRSSPVIGSDGTIYVGSFDEHLYAINPDGTKKWKFDADETIRSTSAIGADGTIYFGSFDGNLHALNPDGTKKWEYLCTDAIKSASPTIGTDSTIYIGSMDTYIYAIEGNSGGLILSTWPKFRSNLENTGKKTNIPIEASSTQASGITVTIKDSSTKEMTPTEISNTYSTSNSDMLSTLRSFNATINLNGGCATFKFNSTISLTEAKVSDLKLVKYYDTNGSSLTYRTYAASGPEYAIDGAWWLTNASGNHMAPTDNLTSGDNYYIYFVIRDNGDYDENRTLGKITDPVGLVNNSNRSGCTLNPNADLSIEWIFMGIIAAALMLRRKLMN